MTGFLTEENGKNPWKTASKNRKWLLIHPLTWEKSQKKQKRETKKRRQIAALQSTADY